MPEPLVCSRAMKIWLQFLSNNKKKGEGGGEEHPVEIITTSSITGSGGFASKVAKTKNSHGL